MMMAAALLSACGGRTEPPRTAPPRTTDRDRADPRAPSASPVLRVEVGPRGSRQIAAVSLEDYVRDVIVGEISVAATDARLVVPVYAAQAIVARTYALAVTRRHAADDFDLCSTTHCQVYVRNAWRRSRWAGYVDEAVRRTRGQVLSDGRGPIEAVFHAHCGGHTSAAADVWRSPGASYLRGVEDAFCVREQPAAWSYELTRDALRDALNTRERSRVGGRLDAVQILRRDAGGRVVDVVVTGSRSPVVTGEDLRLAVIAAAGARSLRSARFDVRRTGDTLHFEGSGAGHGVGMCQVGLIGRLRAGHTPEAVLRTYYPGTTIVTMAMLSS